MADKQLTPPAAASKLFRLAPLSGVLHSLQAVLLDSTMHCTALVCRLAPHARMRLALCPARLPCLAFAQDYVCWNPWRGTLKPSASSLAPALQRAFSMRFNKICWGTSGQRSLRLSKSALAAASALHLCSRRAPHCREGQHAALILSQPAAHMLLHQRLDGAAVLCQVLQRAGGGAWVGCARGKGSTMHRIASPAQDSNHHQLALSSGNASSGHPGSSNTIVPCHTRMHRSPASSWAPLPPAQTQPPPAPPQGSQLSAASGCGLLGRRPPRGGGWARPACCPAAGRRGEAAAQSGGKKRVRVQFN